MKKFCSLLVAASMALSLAAPLQALATDDVSPAGEADTAVTVSTSESAAKEGIDAEPTPIPETETAPEETAEPEPTASATPEETAEAEPTADPLAALATTFAELPTAEALGALEGEELDDEMNKISQAMLDYSALSEEDQARFQEEYPELYQAVMVDLVAALNAGISPNSLRPMPEVENVYMTLNSYSEDALHYFPVDDILPRLTDEMGESLGVTNEDVSTIWFYFANDDREEYHHLGNGETVDLWRYLDYDPSRTTYNLTMVTGNGDQMDDDGNTRYLVTVELNMVESFNFYYSISAMYGYHIDSPNQTARETEVSYFEDVLGMPGFVQHVYDYTGRDTVPEAVRITTDQELLSRNGLILNVYQMKDFLAWRDGKADTLANPITDGLFGAGTAGVTADYTTPATADTCRDASNVWAFVFTDKDSGLVRGYFGMEVLIHKQNPCEIYLDLYASDYTRVMHSGTHGFPGDSVYCTLNLSDTNNIVKVDAYSNSVAFFAYYDDQHSSEERYRLTMQQNDLIKAVYEGSYATEEEAVDVGALNITDQLYGEGYWAIYDVSYGRRFTVVQTNGEIIRFTIYLEPQTDSTPETNPSDLSFSITGAAYLNQWGGRSYYQSYSVMDVDGVPQDTYYRYDEKYDVGGYQLLLVNKELTAEEFNAMMPTFRTPLGVQVNSGRRVESGKTTISSSNLVDGMDDTVQYEVHIPGQKVQNFRVTFKTVQPKAKLFVAGPDERFLNLTGDNNYLHDILVANIGQTDLEGVKVELINPVHVKLDEYWTVDGTIPGFTETTPIYTDAEGNEIGESGTATLSNIAKVRLRADGAGEVSGTLRITAANGDVREIKLTGIAATPMITTTELDEAVKYVPYSYMIATDNMYRWNRTTFTLVDGELPEGLELYENTGEIYGTPQETGTFPITVRVDFSDSRFESATASFDLVVNENTNENVYMETDEGYMIETPIGVEQGEDTYDFLLEDYSTDQLYVSAGEYYEFEDLWLNGEKLVRGVDYVGERGSTRLTIRSQTFADKAIAGQANTLAAEFRVGGDRDNELKRTAQNFRLPEDAIGPEEGGNSATGDQNNSNQGNSGESEGQMDQNTGSSSGGDGGSGEQVTVTNEGTASSGNEAADTAAATASASNSIGLNVYLVDANDRPMGGMTVELHSTPQVAVTNAGGIASFANVEFGAHTLYVKDSDGNVLASRSFTLASGGAGLNGDTVTAVGGSTITLRVKYADGQLSFTRVGVPQTSDSFPYALWIGLLTVSAVGLASLAIYRRRKLHQ